jgi:hypothetical protein
MYSDIPFELFASLVWSHDALLSCKKQNHAKDLDSNEKPLRNDPGGVNRKAGDMYEKFRVPLLYVSWQRAFLKMNVSFRFIKE